MQEVKSSETQLDSTAIKDKIEMLKQEVVDMALRTDIPDKNETMREMSKQVQELTKQLEQQNSHGTSTDTSEDMMSKIESFINMNAESQAETYTEYSDILVRQLIHTIKVVDVHTIKIYFKCGTEYEQSVQAKVKPLNRAS